MKSKSLWRNRRLMAALISYLVLALIATVTLDGFMRAVLWFFFAILAIKSIRHAADADEE